VLLPVLGSVGTVVVVVGAGGTDVVVAGAVVTVVDGFVVVVDG